jgi:hypothetical protein
MSDETKCERCGSQLNWMTIHSPSGRYCSIKCSGAYSGKAPPQPVEPTPGGSDGLFWEVELERDDGFVDVVDCDGGPILCGLSPALAFRIVRAVNAAQRSEPVGSGGVARERIERALRVLYYYRSPLVSARLTAALTGKQGSELLTIERAIDDLEELERTTPPAAEPVATGEGEALRLEHLEQGAKLLLAVDENWREIEDCDGPWFNAYETWCHAERNYQEALLAKVEGVP